MKICVGFYGNVENFDPEVNFITKPSLKSIEKFYSPSGPMSSMNGYEFRPQQLALALAVRDFFADPAENIFVAEAPPGVGKTFAVLIPALLKGMEEGSRILFLTAGIALQEQLIDKDLPGLQKILNEKFEFGLLKGRSHYVCRRKYASFFASSLPDGAAPLLPGLDSDVPDISRWLEETDTGDVAELGLPTGHPVLYQITAGARGCIGSSCPFRERCFVLQSYRKAQNWRVIVANYHLFFSHILEGGGAFPVRYDWLICDEAHRVADAARSSASVKAASSEGSSLLNFKGLQAYAAIFHGNAVDISEVKNLLAESRALLDTVFETAKYRFPQGGGIDICDEELFHKGTAFADSLDKILHLLRPLEERFMAGNFTDKASLRLAAELINWIDGLKDFRKSILWCLKVGEFPRWAYWGTSDGLTSAPVRCSDIVSDVIEREKPDKSIFISATMAIEDDFSFWSEETGIIPDKTLIVESPFDFKRQMEIVVVDVGLAVGSSGYDDKMCRIMKKLCDDNGGRTLVLLSSMRLLNAFARVMQNSNCSYPVLVQGKMPQRDILARFRNEETSILIGSVSFREGVDIPGDGLTQVIIDRIPFPHPNDPLVQARDALEEKKAFVRVTLPMVRLFLRQAVGRLIRSSSDHGRVMLLDGRVMKNKSWKILSALPDCKRSLLTVVDSGENPNRPDVKQ